MEHKGQKILINILAVISTLFLIIYVFFFVMSLIGHFTAESDSLSGGFGILFSVLFFMIAFFVSLIVSGISFIISLLLKLINKLPYKAGLITISVDLGMTLLLLGLLYLIFNVFA